MAPAQRGGAATSVGPNCVRPRPSAARPYAAQIRTPPRPEARRTKRMPPGRQSLCATKSRTGGYGELRVIFTGGAIIIMISVAYGNQLAGVGEGELSLGEIAQSGNTVCGRRAGSRVNVAGVTGGPTKPVAPHRLRDSRHAVCSPVRRNSIGGKSGRVDGSGGSEVHASTEVGGLQRAPAVVPDQRFGEGQAGGTREKRC